MVKLTVLGCLILTAFVVHTALRIEHVNLLCGTVLPLTPEQATRWEIPELNQVIDYCHRQIAIRRADAYSMTHPDEVVPPTDEFQGEPFNESEQGFINRSVHNHAIHSELHWWVTTLGGLQYLLAPMAFFWSVGNFLTVRQAMIRVLSTGCAALAFAAIFLMVLRGY